MTAWKLRSLKYEKFNYCVTERVGPAYDRPGLLSHILILPKSEYETNFTFSEQCIVIHIREKDQQDAHFS